VVGNSGVGAFGFGGSAGADSYFVSVGVVKGGGGSSSGGTYTGDGGGNGGAVGGQRAGGGAGGYAGSGGSGCVNAPDNGNSGSGSTDLPDSGILSENIYFKLDYPDGYYMTLYDDFAMTNIESNKLVQLKPYWRMSPDVGGGVYIIISYLL
jgi:hypothetical protein